MSEIELLARKVADLAGSAGFWNKAMLYCLGAAAVVAVLIAITTRLAIVRTDQLSEARSELSEAKERQFSLDLKEKEGRIIALGLQSKTLENANVSLRTDLEHASSESRSKQTELEKEQQKTALAQKEAANAQLALVRAVEMVSTPRRIFLGRLGRDNVAWAANLKEVQKYAGMTVVITSIPDVEAQQLASDIRFTLRDAGWNATLADAAESSKIPLNVFEEGVQVRTLEKTAENSGPTTMDSPSGHAAQAVIGLLNVELGPPHGPPFAVSWRPEVVVKEASGDFQVGLLLRTGFSFPDGGIVITVGLKPTQQFLLFNDPAHPTNPK